MNFPMHASAVPQRGAPRAGARGRRGAAARGGAIRAASSTRSRIRTRSMRSVAARRTCASSTSRCRTSTSASNYQDFQRYHARGPGDQRRRAGEPAGADRRGEARDDGSTGARALLRARQKLEGGAREGAQRARGRGGASAGTCSRSRPRGSPPETWNAIKERALVARGERPHPVGAAPVADDRVPPDARRLRARRAWATRRRLRSASRSPTSRRGSSPSPSSPDGDLMYSPGVLWTAAYHKIPMLYVMHNNRAYHQEIMHVQRMAALHNRRRRPAHGSAPPSTIPRSTTRSSRRRKACGRRARSTDPAKLRPGAEARGGRW